LIVALLGNAPLFEVLQFGQYEGYDTHLQQPEISMSKQTTKMVTVLQPTGNNAEYKKYRLPLIPCLDPQYSAVSF
jgi:hypothetical protein